MKIIDDTSKFIRKNGIAYISAVTSISAFLILLALCLCFFVEVNSFIILLSLIFFVPTEVTIFVAALIPFIILILIVERVKIFQKQWFFVIGWIFISIFVYSIIILMGSLNGLRKYNLPAPALGAIDWYSLFFGTLIFIIAGIIAGMVCWRLKKDKFGRNHLSLPDNS